MNVKLRAACDADFAFARCVFYETMRWIIERLVGWDEVREDKNFAQFFKLDEVRINTADGQDVGWVQEQIEDTTINLGAAAGRWNSSSSDIAYTRQESNKSNYPSSSKDQSGGPVLRETRISDYARGRAKVLYGS